MTDLEEAKQHIRALMVELASHFPNNQCPCCWATVGPHEDGCKWVSAQAFLDGEGQTVEGGVWDENAQRSYSAAELKKLLDGRDEFIVGEGLWGKFVDGLKDQTEGSGG
jgi:hypothetical protein